MPITLEKEWTEGWLRRNPNDLCLVINFVNGKNGKRMFQYAPKYEDMKFFKDVFEELAEYEKKKQEKKKLKCSVRGKVDADKSPDLL